MAIGLRSPVSFPNIINILGVFGVTASLVFVGLELRQSQRIALAEQMNNRVNVLMSLVNSYIEADLDFLSAMVNDPAKDQQYTSAEKGARNMLNAQWTLHENDYFQYNSGLMTEDLWQAKLGATKRDLLKCEHPDIFEWRIALVEQGFRKIIEKMREADPCRN